MKKSLITSFFVILVCSVMGQSHEAVRALRVGSTGYAYWINPDRFRSVKFDFNDGQLPEGWTTQSEGDIASPWHIESPATHPQLTDFPPDGSSYAFVEVGQNTEGSFFLETMTSSSLNVSDLSDDFYPKDCKGTFVDDNTVMLEWKSCYGIYAKNHEITNGEEKSWRGGNHVVTHPGAGYNNGWDVSALHDGLASYGFNADHEAGLKIADKFIIDDSYCWGINFYLYQGPTPEPTITGAYVSIYDGNPAEGGQLINVSKGFSTQMAEIYRTGETDFSDTQRPIVIVSVSIPGFEELPHGTYWVEASFTGSLPGGVWVLPENILGETTTGEGMVYTPETGWQPCLDAGTLTQQGFAFDWFYTGAEIAAQICRIFRDGEMIYEGLPEKFGNYQEFVDNDVSYGIHTYGIQNGYWLVDNNGEDMLVFTPVIYFDVRPCYAPENLDGSMEEQGDGTYLANIVWDAARPIPHREDITTMYNVYRKEEHEYQIVATIPENGSTSYSFTDTVTEEGIYYYKVNAYNVYEAGSCLSNFALYVNDSQMDYLCLSTGSYNFAVGSIWYYEIYPQGEEGTVYYEMMESAGDTVINGKEKVKIIVKTPAMYKGGVSREYVYCENGMVFWYSPSINDFTKLYDFNAEKNDSWVINYNGQPNRVWVNEVAYEEINGITYKTMEVADDYGDFSGKIICGIGHTTYLFPFSTFGSKAEGDHPHELRCYFYYSNNLMLSMGNHDCDDIYPLSVGETHDSRFAVYPNPADATITIEGDDIQRIEIYNVLGQQIYSENTTNTTAIINVSDFNKGVYIVSIIDNQGSISNTRLLIK